MLPLPPLRDRDDRHELQPAPGGGDQQRQVPGQDVRHHQGQRGRGGLLKSVDMMYSMKSTKCLVCQRKEFTMTHKRKMRFCGHILFIYISEYKPERGHNNI